jgi:hypothetical protein
MTAIGRGFRLVPDVLWLSHDPPPARELQQDAVGVLEVERADEHAGMQFPGDPVRAVVVIDDRAHPHALGFELGAVVQELFLGHVKRDVVHRANGAGPLPEAGHRHRRGDAGNRLWRVREPEERQRVATAHVKEEVLTRVTRQIQRLDQPHAKHLRVELDSLFHVRADQSEVIDTAQIELLVLPLHAGLLRCAATSRVRCGLCPNLNSGQLYVRSSAAGRAAR